MDYKLIASGCSNTFGQALPDVWDKKKQDAIFSRSSKFSWPQVLADKLNIKCINKSRPGASNKEIWNAILNGPQYWGQPREEYSKKHIVIILWTFVNRFCFLESDDYHRDIRPKEIRVDALADTKGSLHNAMRLEAMPQVKQVKQLGTWWAETGDRADERRENSKIFFKYFFNERDLLMDFYLRVNHVDTFLKGKVKKVVHCLQDDLYKPEPEWNNVEFYDEWKNIDDTYDKAEDGIHEGIDKHEKFATSLYNEIIDEL